MLLRLPEPASFEHLLRPARIEVAPFVRLSRQPATEPYWRTDADVAAADRVGTAWLWIIQSVDPNRTTAGTQALTQLPLLLLFGAPGELTLALMMGAAWVANLAVAEWLLHRERVAEVQVVAMRGLRTSV